MARRRARLNLFDKIFLGFLAAMLVAVAFMALVIAPIQNAKNQAFQDTMSGLNMSIRAESSTTKAVTLEDGEYSTQYIPEELQAQSPDEVRYVVLLEKSSVRVGYYTGGGGAYQRVYNLSIRDLATGEIIASQEFNGGYPPQQTTKKGNVYGSAPSSEKIREWVDSYISG